PLCFDARVNPDFRADYELCRWFSRDAGNGEIVDLMDINQNVVGAEVSGVDAQFDWSFGAGPGTVAVNLLASWLDYYEVVDVEGLPVVDRTGQLGLFI